MDISMIEELLDKFVTGASERQIWLVFKDCVLNDKLAANAAAQNIMEIYKQKYTKSEEEPNRRGMDYIYNLIAMFARCTPWNHPRQYLLLKLLISLCGEWNKNYSPDVNQTCMTKVFTDNDVRASRDGNCLPAGDEMLSNKWVNISSFIARCIAAGVDVVPRPTEFAADVIENAFRGSQITHYEVAVAAQYILLMGDMLRVKCMVDTSERDYLTNKHWIRWRQQFEACLGIEEDLGESDQKRYMKEMLEAVYNKMLSSK